MEGPNEKLNLRKLNDHCIPEWHLFVSVCCDMVIYDPIVNFVPTLLFAHKDVHAQPKYVTLYGIVYPPSQWCKMSSLLILCLPSHLKVVTISKP